MSTTRHVYVSGPRETYLDARTRELRSAVLGQIRRIGYEIAAFGTLEGGLGLAAGSTWSRSGAMAVMRRCVGAVLLGFPYWRSHRDGDDVGLVTEYCHYEGALAAMLESGSGDEAVPRDNVLFESGYFTHAKGKERVLIVRETGVKMPADLGGDIYVPFLRDQVGDLLDGVSRFIRGTFGRRE
jgi:hypothetical protein